MSKEGRALVYTHLNVLEYGGISLDEVEAEGEQTNIVSATIDHLSVVEVQFTRVAKKPTQLCLQPHQKIPTFFGTPNLRPSGGKSEMLPNYQDDHDKLLNQLELGKNQREPWD